MARKPIDQRHPDAGRAALWSAIRQLKSFTVTQLRRETLCTISQTREYVRGLTAAGILERGTDILSKPSESTLYTLACDPGAEAPRVRRDGTTVTMGQGRLQLWRSMRVLGRFTIADLVVIASTEECIIATSEAKSYCLFLCRAGYLARLSDNNYRFVSSRYSGPQPPQIQRIKQVYDPNLKQVVWSGKDNGGCR